LWLFLFASAPYVDGSAWDSRGRLSLHGLLATEGAEGAAEGEMFVAAAAWGAFAEADFERGGEEAPGFAIFFKVGTGGAAGGGIEADALTASDGLDGDEVPDVFGDDIADEEVDFGGGVDAAVGSTGIDPVAALGEAGGGFDLHAEKSAAEFDGGVVRVAVSPREADREAECGGAGEESGFGGFSATLAGVGDGVDGERGVWGNEKSRFLIRAVAVFGMTSVWRRDY
jgi:hypothetical protein